MSKAKHWLFTLNNPTPDEVKEQLSHLPTSALYLCYGREVGESGTPHLQGYITWRNRRSLRQCKQFLLRAHWTIARGTPQENMDYCEKDATEENPFVQFGELPVKKGSRSDLDTIRQSIKDGATALDIADNHFSQWCFHRKSFAAYRTLLQPASLRPDLRVIVLEGPTGIGKTRFATEYARQNGGFWISPDPTLQWFDGYAGQPNVIIDDLDGVGVSFRFLLRVLDIYELEVPIKGGFTPWIPSIIFITTNVAAESWFATVDVAPLRRRLSWQLMTGSQEGQDWPDYFTEVKNTLQL